MEQCDGCGHMKPDPENQPHGIYCEVEPDDLPDEVANQLVLYWNSDGLEAECPCDID